MLDISEPCEDGRCYSSYDTTLNLDYDKSHFSCSGQGTCLSINGMCQGLSSCGDSQVCDEELRCASEQETRKAQEEKSLNTSQVQHTYCRYSRDEGDKAYNRIDRSDEKITNTINIKQSPMIDYRYLTPCNNY